MSDLSSRLSNRVQLSSDALSAYVAATEEAFGANVDYGQIVKSYEAEPIGPGRYSPPKVTSVERSRVIGDPDPKHISTSYIERTREHESGGRSALRALQLRENAPHDQVHASDASERRERAMVD